MQSGHNEPPPDDFSSDHDRLVFISSRLSTAEEEISKLRDWRHDVVAPVMMAIQAQQKTNAEAIGKLTENITTVVTEVRPLMGVPLMLENHRRDAASFSKRMDENLDRLQNTVEQNRVSGIAGQQKLMWTMGVVIIIALCAIVGAQWAILSPLLQLKGH